MVGPFAEVRLTISVISFLSLLAPFGTQVFLKHFDDVEDECFRQMVLTYNQIFLKWQERNLGKHAATSAIPLSAGLTSGGTVPIGGKHAATSAMPLPAGLTSGG